MTCRHARELGLKDDYMKEMDAASSADENKENKRSWRPGKGGWPDVEIRLPHGMRPDHQVSLALCPGGIIHE